MKEQTTTSVKTATHCLALMNRQAHDQPALSMNTPIGTKDLLKFYQMFGVTYGNGKTKSRRLPIPLIMPILN